MENNGGAIEPRKCALDSCDEVFSPRVHNQRFHSRECTRVYTNARILAQYHQKKNRVLTGRKCKTRNCDTVLSRYNEEEICASCENKAHIKKLEDWGWEVEKDEW